MQYTSVYVLYQYERPLVTKKVEVQYMLSSLPMSPGHSWQQTRTGTIMMIVREIYGPLILAKNRSLHSRGCE